MPENPVSVRIQTKSRLLREQLEEIIRSAGGANIQRPEDAGFCDLLIMEMDDETEQAFQSLSAVQSSGLAGEVFVTSASTNPDILIRMLRMGMREFFSQPLNKGDVRNALLKFIERHRPARERRAPAAKKKGKIISIMGSKGGMGATTIAVNLAACLKELEGVESVAIVDMNPVLGEVPFFLNVDVNGFDWLDVSKNISRVDATYLMSILLKHPSGIRILPPPTSMIDDHEQIARSMGILFTKMQHMFDFTVVDIGKSINAVSTTVLKMSDRIVIAVQMSLSCLIGVKRIREALQGFDNLNGDGIDVVVNRYQKNSLFTLKEAEESLKKKILWTIPNDYKTVFSAINQGKPLNLAAGGTEISKNFTELASMISEKRGKTERKKTGLFGLRSFA